MFVGNIYMVLVSVQNATFIGGGEEFGHKQRVLTFILGWQKIRKLAVRIIACVHFNYLSIRIPYWKLNEETMELLKGDDSTNDEDHTEPR